MSKTFLAVGAVTLTLVASSAVAKDTDEDAKLREALREKMSDLSGTSEKKPAQAAPAKAPAKAQPAPPTATKSAKPAPTPAPKAAAAPAATSAQTEKPVLAPVMEDSPEAAKMREVLHQRLEKEAAKPTVVVATPPPKVEVEQTKPATTAKKVTPTKKPEPNPVAAKESKPKKTGYMLLETPELPISASKDERLKQLLERYKADEITPLEYHTERAKIIAE